MSKPTKEQVAANIARTDIHDNLKLMRSPNEFALRDTPALTTNTNK